MPIAQIPVDSSWKIVSSSFVVDPKFAVKELIDNALDAGATNIYVDVDSKTCGCDYICVRDDGTGISEEDRQLVCLNHSTSKIESFNDLTQLSTLGFRGEALFLLATLSNMSGSMEITTRTKDDSVAEKWLVTQQGEIKNNKRSKVPSSEGTNIVVRRLLGGLKSRYIHVSSRALRNIDEFKNLISHYSLNFRDVRFHFSLVKLERNGTISEKRLQQSLNTNISRDRALSIIAQLRKPSALTFVIKNELEVSNLVTLDIILPTMNPKSDVVNVKRSKRFFSVNKRLMSLKIGFGQLFSRMINAIYHKLQMLEPMVWFINLNCPMKILDVNIEPGKDDILIKNMNFFLEQAERALSSYLCVELGVEPNDSTTAPRKLEMNKSNHQQGEFASSQWKTQDTDTVVQEQGTRQSLSSTNQPITSKTREENAYIDNILRKKQELTINNKSRDLNRDFTSESAILREGDRCNNLQTNFEFDIDHSNGENSEVPSTSTYNNNESVSSNEELGRAKRVDISNQSLITKFCRENEIKDKEILSPKVSVGNNTNHSQNISDPQSSLLSQASTDNNWSQRTADITFQLNNGTKMRKLNRNEEKELLSLQFKPIVDRQNSTSNNAALVCNKENYQLDDSKTRRHLTMFSEYTNSYTLCLDCSNIIPVKCNEHEGDQLNQIVTPSNNLLRGIEQALTQKVNRETMLSSTEEGWYLLVR